MVRASFVVCLSWTLSLFLFWTHDVSLKQSGRQFEGELSCFDKNMNIVLSLTYETRTIHLPATETGLFLFH